MAAKSNIAPFLLLAAGGGGLLYAYKRGMLHKLFANSARTTRNNVAELKLRFTGFHNSSNNVFADIEALNPTSIPFQVQSILGDFYVSGQRAGSVKMFGDQVIRPNDDATLSVAVRVMPAAAGMWRKKGQPVQFRGQININNNILPLTMNYQL